jgi:CHASE2 domain-containing sensor protein
MKQVILRFAEGDFSRGFATVTAQVWEADHAHSVQAVGSLPAAPQLAIALQQWRLLYVALYHRLDLHTRIDIELADVTNVSEVEFTHLCQAVHVQLNDWLNAATFRNIDQRLRTQLTPADKIRCLIETNQPQLWLLPWHLWQFFEDFPQAEVALSVANYRRSQLTTPLITTGEVRILAVLGNSEAIDIETDRRYLEQLSTEATVQFLVQPSREVLDAHLRQRWHVLFFAGHSSSSTAAIAPEPDAEGSSAEATPLGHIAINATARLTLEQLRYALRQAIAQGLQLAIFNSCDGLGLARSLADLQIPQVIVMREPVPDIVAQRFLKHFLTAFTSGRSLYSSVREARERLQGLESYYPCASWLPVICQNPSVPPTSWQDWCGAPPQTKQAAPPPPQPKSAQIWLRALKALLISLLITLLLITLRFFGFFEASELRAYDHLMQWRTPESQDQRLLIIAVTEQDLGLAIQHDRKGSLSDAALSQVLDILVAAQPRAIGLDILRDFPVKTDQANLIKQMQTYPDFFAICWGSDPDTDSPGVAPPPEVPLLRQGFADVSTDADGVVRRHLIAMNPIADSPCQAANALSTQLASYYLEAEQITAQYTAAHQLQIGNIIFPRLLRHQGGYHKADTQGYQILINYRQVDEVAPIKTLAEVLSGQLQPEEVRDRVVLIGVTAPSVKDVLLTPLRVDQHSSRRMFGVMLQAQMVSHLISTVKDGRPQIRPWSFRGDAIWIWLWCSLAGLLTLLFRHPLQLFFYTGILLGVLYLSCYQLLTVGWWVPLIPVAIGLIVTTAAVSSSGQIGKTGD